MCNIYGKLKENRDVIMKGVTRQEIAIKVGKIASEGKRYR